MKSLLEFKNRLFMKIRADVNQAGTIIIGAKTPGGGWLKEYEFSTAEALHETAARHDWVVRPSGKTLKGINYTLRMAKNDFSQYSTKHISGTESAFKRL